MELKEGELKGTFEIVVKKAKEVTEKVKRKFEEFGVKIINVDTKEDKIIINIEGDLKNRPHNIILRVRKDLAKEGIKFRKIGIVKYEIELVFDENLPNFKTYPLVKEFKIEKNRFYCVLENIDEQTIEEGTLDRLISYVKEKALKYIYSGKAEFWKLVRKSDEKKMYTNEDPTELMLKAKWIEKFPGMGQWYLLGPATKLGKHFINQVIEFLEKEGFQEIIMPKLIPFQIHVKSGHLRGSAHEMYLVAHPKKRDREFFEEFYDYVTVTRKVDKKLLREKFDDFEYALCYAQCPPFYWLIKGKRFKLEDLPVKVYDFSGPSWRYEKSGIRGLERVNEFHRLEVIWLGTPEQVKEIRDKIANYVIELIDKYYDLEWRLAHVTPFYLAHEGKAGGEEFPWTYDLEVYLPYKGDRENKNAWVEIASFNIHGDHYTKEFNIKGSKGEELWTGCVGLSIERFLAVFIGQKGIDTKNWPEKLVKDLGKLKNNIRYVQ